MEAIQGVRWGALVVCAATVFVCLKAPVLKLPIPPQFAGLACGFALHYVLQTLSASAVGDVVGDLDGLAGGAFAGEVADLDDDALRIRADVADESHGAPL